MAKRVPERSRMYNESLADTLQYDLVPELPFRQARPCHYTPPSMTAFPVQNMVFHSGGVLGGLLERRGVTERLRVEYETSAACHGFKYAVLEPRMSVRQPDGRPDRLCERNRSVLDRYRTDFSGKGTVTPRGGPSRRAPRRCHPTPSPPTVASYRRGRHRETAEDHDHGPAFRRAMQFSAGPTSFIAARSAGSCQPPPTTPPPPMPIWRLPSTRQ